MGPEESTAGVRGLKCQEVGQVGLRPHVAKGLGHA